MRVTVILLVISVLGTIPRGFVKELEELEIRGGGENCWGQSKYWEKSGRPEEFAVSQNFSEITSANAGVKILQGLIS